MYSIQLFYIVENMAGNETINAEFHLQAKSTFSTYSPELVSNLDETQLSSTLSSTYKAIKSSYNKIRLVVNKHNATAMMCCISVSGKKLQLYQLCQGNDQQIIE